MITTSNDLTENSNSQITIVIYCPFCGTENRYLMDDYSNDDYYGIIFCIGCGKQI